MKHYTSWFFAGTARERNSSGSPPYPANFNAKTIYSEIIDATLPRATRQRLAWTLAFPTPNAVITVDWRPLWQSNPVGTVFFSRSTGGAFDFFAPGTGVPRAMDAFTIMNMLGETHHLETRMGGTPADPCDFTECQWSPGDSDNFVDLEFLFGDPMLESPIEFFHASITGSNSFRIFDRYP